MNWITEKLKTENLKTRKYNTEIKGGGVVWLAMLLGAFCFLWLYGFRVLEVTNIDWLFNGSDLTQHYEGWKFYRNSSWKFPVGLLDTLAYPNETSVIYTDSIPLAALLFKCLSFCLPESFQYFGLWGLLCFILQGGIGALILRRFLKQPYEILCGAALLILAPVCIFRMFMHTALAAQWLILFAIALVIYRSDIGKLRHLNAWWVCLGVLCGGIHAYFLPMCGSVLIYGMALTVRERGGWKRIWLPALSFAAGALVTIWLFGGFQPGLNSGGEGLGFYSFNLNGLWNPQGWSRVLRDLNLGGGQYEGFAYLGLGMLFLLLFRIANVIVIRFKTGRDGEQRERGKRTDIPGTLPMLFIGAAVVLFAASPLVTWGDRLLVQWPLPGIAVRVWSIFRSTGRMIWPVYYGLILWGIGVTSKRMVYMVNQRNGGDQGSTINHGSAVNQESKINQGHVKAWIGSLVLTAALALQIYDLSLMLSAKSQFYRQEVRYESGLQDEAWKIIGENEDIAHIILFSSYADNPGPWYDLAEYASNYKITLNDFYFARSNGEAIHETWRSALEDIWDNTIYLFKQKEKFWCQKYDMHYYQADQYLVGSKAPINGLEEWEQPSNFLNQFEFEFNGSVGAEPVTAGAGIKAPAGVYEIVITGSGLEGLSIYCQYDEGGNSYGTFEDAAGENKFTCKVEIWEDLNDLQVVLSDGGAKAVVEKVVIYFRTM